MPGKSVVGLVIFDAVDSFVDIDVVVVVVGPFIFDVVVDSLADSLIVGLVFFDVVVDSSMEEILVCRVIFGVVGDVVEVWEHVR